MTVFLGDSGRILLRRKGSEQAMYSEINASDVRDDANRFSIDFAYEQLISGDRLEVRTVNGSMLSWIDHPDVDNSFTRFIHVDAVGGIRFYESFSDAIAGKAANAVPLKKPGSPQAVELRVVESGADNCLAKVTSYEITTSRETIDTTNLGALYRKQYESGLIQGQGQIECLWSAPGVCDGDGEDLEFSSYLARLCIRLVHGAAFHGFFFIYDSDRHDMRSVWYESETCIVTNVAITVEPTQMIRTSISFVSSGPIALREGFLGSFIQLEDGSYVRQEDAFAGRIELENPD